MRYNIVTLYIHGRIEARDRASPGFYGQDPILISLALINCAYSTLDVYLAILAMGQIDENELSIEKDDGIIDNLFRIRVGKIFEAELSWHRSWA